MAREKVEPLAKDRYMKPDIDRIKKILYKFVSYIFNY